MAQMQQCLESPQTDDFAEKLEKAKQLYCLLDDLTFGDEIDSAKSRCILKRIL